MVREFARYAIVAITLYFSSAVCADGNSVNETTNNTPPDYQSIPFKQAEDVKASKALSIGAIFIFVIIVAVIAVAILKKFLVDKDIMKLASSRIKLVEAKRLSPKVSIFLVQVDGKEYLLTQSNSPTHVINHNSGEG